jgi:bifunctional non-homologous end joining protein LigD
MARSATLKSHDAPVSPKKKLETYRKMRDFSSTKEPRGDDAASRKKAKALSFVVQKHAASHLHYDFRLELDGVLLSWAVPKGPSLDPSIKRLAMETEPHPLDYGGFEGTIPQGEYGGGTVMVWDRGTWEPQEDPRKGYEKGHLKFSLEGEKLAGSWHLVRAARGSGKEGRGWLLFKSRDEFSRPGENAIVEEEPDSVLTGRSIERIAHDAGEPVPKSASRDRARKSPGASAGKGKSKPGEAAPSAAELAKLPRAKKGKLSRVSGLELATLVDEAPEGPDWVHEIKFDGYRVLARVENGEVTLLSRNGHDWTERMPTLARSLKQFKAKSVALDGEFVALNEKGVSDFQTLQNSLGAQDSPSLIYYVFDLLHLDGVDLTALPLNDRKALLARLLAAQPARLADHVRLSEHVVGGGPAFFQKACELGLEGIVSKRAESPYTEGRGRDWVKTKCVQRQEFVVVGYTDPGGSRTGLGALLLGVREGKRLRYAGKVGTGFSRRSLIDLVKKLEPLVVKQAMVNDAPRGAAASDVHWVKPELVAEVAFTGFTSDGLLRHPRFHGLREDKSPGEVVLEEAVKPPRAKATAKSKARTKPASDFQLSNPDKILFPEAGITKRDVLEYYELVAERMLPHVANRPLTLVRCPNGWQKACFFQKHPGQGLPDALRTVAIREKEGKAPYAVLDDAQGIFSLVQLGALEIHTWGSYADDFERPNLLVFDLDPDPAVKFESVIDCALRLREIFTAAKLESFVKTTGGKGLHVCLPIEPELEWPEIKAFCKELVEALVRESPNAYVSTVSKAERKGKIFIDYLRNARGATFIAPYSTRARANAPIAVPLEWDELDASFRPGQVTLRNVQTYLTEHKKDPFARMPKVKQRLPRLTF